jgi:hypothetical protein
VTSHDELIQPKRINLVYNAPLQVWMKIDVRLIQNHAVTSAQADQMAKNLQPNLKPVARPADFAPAMFSELMVRQAPSGCISTSEWINVYV